MTAVSSIPEGQTVPDTEKQAQDVSSSDSSVQHPEFEKAPDGGLKAWLVAAGAGCVFFAGLGFTNSNGIFLEYYAKHQLTDQSADNIAWIGSLSTFIQFGSGMIGGPLFDRFGSWVSSCNSAFRIERWVLMLK